MSALRFICAALLLAASAAVLSQPAKDCPPPAPGAESLRAAAAGRQERDRGLLWRLEKEGRTSWLYGTVHASRAEWAFPGPTIQRAVLASDVVVLELDPTDPSLPRLFMARGDPGREERVLAGLRPRLERLAARGCLPAAQLTALRPVFQLILLSLVEARREGFHAELAVDAVLFGMARRLGKEVVALETPAAQMAALLPASETDERVLMERGLQDLESGDGAALMTRMLQTWADGDEERLASYPQWCRCLETEVERRYFRQLNDDRNGPIADKLAALHAGGQTFFAGVGALHMTGDRALPALLRERGFQVTRIPFASNR